MLKHLSSLLAAGIMTFSGCEERRWPTKKASLEVLRPIAAEACNACSAVVRTNQRPRDIDFTDKVKAKNRRMEEEGFDSDDLIFKCIKPAEDLAKIIVTIRTGLFEIEKYQLCDSNTPEWKLFH